MLVVLVIRGVVLRVLCDVVVMVGTYIILVTLETSQLLMSWLNDEARENMPLYVTNTNTDIENHCHSNINNPYKYRYRYICRYRYIRETRQHTQPYQHQHQ